MREREQKPTSQLPPDDSTGNLGKEWGEMSVQWGSNINTSLSAETREKVSKFYEKM